MSTGESNYAGDSIDNSRIHHEINICSPNNILMELHQKLKHPEISSLRACKAKSLLFS